MSVEQESESKVITVEPIVNDIPFFCQFSADAITEDSLDLSPGITEDDKLLWRKDKNAVDFSLNYAKLWCKFCKELVTALEKKAVLEIELCRSWAKQFQSFESTVSSSTMFGAPMRTESLMMSKLIIDQCKEIEAQNTKKLGKLLDVISRQRTEFSKTRKHYKEKWKSDCKKMLDAENTMLKTKAAYYQRCQQGVKLREELTIAQALLTYMQEHGVQETVGTANVSMTTNVISQSNNLSLSDGSGSTIQSASSNPSQNEPISASQMSKQKQKVDKLEKQLADNDKKEIEQMYSYKESVETANNKLIEFEKKKMEHLCDIRLTTSRSDEIVKDTLAEYLKILSETRTTMMNEYGTLSTRIQEYKPCHEYRCLIEKQLSNKPDVYSEKFQVELYHDCASSKEKSDSQASRGFARLAIGSGKESEHESNRNRPALPSHSDSDSESEVMNSTDGVSTSGTNRTGVLNTIVEFGSNLFRQGGGSSVGNPVNEGTKRNQPLKNKKSTSGSTSSMTGSAEGLGERDLDWQKEVDGVTDIILKCFEIIELNGLTTHGIYRISASKLKVGLVMESLNNQGLDTDLINEQPITLANVVKSKIISLTEPIVPYNLYNEFVDLGKEAETGELSDPINKLKALIVQLPSPNKRLAGLVFHHLKKIANNSEENQMSSANLGTLFAPTLIKAKPRFRMADIKEYMDNKSQAKIVQIIIDNVEVLFGPADQYYFPRMISKDESSESDKMKLSDEKDESPISKSNSEIMLENKIKQQRPHSSIIEANVSLSPEPCFSRPLTGSLRVPLSSQPVVTTPVNTQPDKPPPKMMDMLFGMDTVPTIRSTSPRAKKISNDSSTDKDPPVQDDSSSDKTSTGLPHRSISVGSGPLPESIKLAQLSKPSTDSIFSKSKEIENTMISEKSTAAQFSTTSRHNDLKRSFISSTDSTTNISKTSQHSSTLADENNRSSNVLLSRSRPTSATTRSTYNYSSSNIDSPAVPGGRESIEYSALQSHLSFDPISETTLLSSSTLNTDNSLFITETSPKVKMRYRSKSYAMPAEPHNNTTNNNYKTLIRNSSISSSPFIRQSKIRVPLSAKSLSDLRNVNHKPVRSVSNSKLFPGRQCDSMDRFLMKFCSVDHINTLINSQIAKYQSWLTEPVLDEFYV